MKKYALIVEYPGGTDKASDGHRRDSQPILDSLKKISDIDGEIIFYDENKQDELFDFITKNASIVIGRINPGNLKAVDGYFQFLKRLSDKGVKIFTHPDVMINLDFKDILAKMKDSEICDSETEFHQNFESFSKKFPETLKKYGIRVLKTNYGSTGEGVYLVKINKDGTITQTEAVNNEKENFSNLEEFMKNFEKNFEEDDEDAVYFKGKKGFVECRYLPRISEGEVRILLVNDKPVSVVDKKPSEGNFSATLFSGAQYSYESPEDEKRKEVVDLTKKSLEKDVKKHLNGFDFPLLWTMDFIRDFDENGKTKFILSEINCSCVGITTQMELADDVAKVFA